MFVPCDSIEEAHFVASVLNSSLVQLIVMSYTIETAMSTHILEHVRVPKFDLNDKAHRELSELAKRAREYAKKRYEMNYARAERELNSLEAAINSRVAELFEISPEQL